MEIFPAPKELGDPTLENVNFTKILISVLLMRLGGDEVLITQKDFDLVARKYLLVGEDHLGYYLKLVNTLEEAQNANSKPN